MKKIHDRSYSIGRNIPRKLENEIGPKILIYEELCDVYFTNRLPRETHETSVDCGVIILLHYSKDY